MSWTALNYHNGRESEKPCSSQLRIAAMKTLMGSLTGHWSKCTTTLGDSFHEPALGFLKGLGSATSDAGLQQYLLSPLEARKDVNGTFPEKATAQNWLQYLYVAFDA